VLSGEKTIADITLEGPLGVKIVPAGSGIRELTALNAVQWRRFQKIIQTISAELDFLLIDTAAGVSDNVVELLHLAGRVLVVTSYDPAAVVDAYAMIKILSRTTAKKDIGIVVNATKDADEAGLVFRQLDIAATRFLQRSLRFDGYVVSDPAVREAALGQRPIVDHLPQSPASRCFRILASRLAGYTPDGGASRGSGSHPYVMSSPTLSLEATRCA
jgi:flagellar biosynthesis protein FlhG